MSAVREQREHLDVQIRWLIRRDMQEVLRIESASFEFPWTDEDFLCCLRQRNCIGMVAEHDHKIVGFMIYELHKSRLQILNFAVAPEVRLRGIGSQMVLRLIDKLSQQRRNEILLECRERMSRVALVASGGLGREVGLPVRLMSVYVDETGKDMVHRPGLGRAKKGKRGEAREGEEDGGNKACL